MTTDTSAEALERKRFEEWYATHAHNYARDPVGSRDCGLQWDAWKAALAAEKRRAREGVMDESKTRAWNEYYSNAVSRLTSIHELDVYWAFEGGWDAALEAVWPDGRDAKDECLKCGAAIDEEYGHVGECIDATKDTDHD